MSTNAISKVKLDYASKFNSLNFVIKLGPKIPMLIPKLRLLTNRSIILT